MAWIVSRKAYSRLTSILYLIIIMLFVSGAGLAVAYQLGYLHALNSGMPFLEPDNYEYYLFAQLAISHPGLSPYNITNPYLLGAPAGFFEHPGLYLMPVYLYGFLHLPLVWDFRILQILAVLITYLFTLLLAKKVLDALPIDKVYRWLTYTIVITSFLLMQYSEITEWRGNEFITAIAVVVVYALAWMYTKRPYWLGLAGFGLGLLAILGIWIWSGGFVIVLLVTALIFALLVYDMLLRKNKRIWRYVALGFVVLAILLFFFYGPIEEKISLFTSSFGFSGCLSNPLNIGEISCLTLSNGLLAILMMLVFGSFSLAAFLGSTVMSYRKKEYEYYLFGVLVAGLLFLPLAMVYIRLLDLIAPFLTILYALGVVAMLSYFSKTGSNRIVLFLTIILILISSFVGQYLFYLSSVTLYGFANPSGLVNATRYMAGSSANASVLAYFGYGGYLEAFGHLHTYSDTVQGLNYSRIEIEDRIFMGNASVACSLLRNVTPAPAFVVLSDNMLNSTLFVASSSSSILRSPYSFNDACGYGLAYNESGFFVFSRKK